jgi:hypothetical protein
VTARIRPTAANDVYFDVNGNAAARLQEDGTLTLPGPVVSAGGQFSSHLTPTVTNSSDLGSSTHRWRNVYTNDLHLSNGIGDYTVVEGEEELYLHNNRTGKSFKFALIPVDPSEVPPRASVEGPPDGL